MRGEEGRKGGREGGRESVCVCEEEGYWEWAGDVYVYSLHVFLSSVYSVMSLKAEIIPYSSLKLQTLDNLEHRKHLARICCLNGQING